MKNEDVTSAESVAKRLVWLRKFLGLPAKEFAASINVTQSTLSNWEGGTQRISLEGALKINAVYGTTLDFLYLDRRDGLPASMARDLSSAPLDNNSSVSKDNPDS